MDYGMNVARGSLTRGFMFSSSALRASDVAIIVSMSPFARIGSFKTAVCDVTPNGK